MLSDYIAHTFIHGRDNNSTPATKYRIKVTSNNKLKNHLIFFFTFPQILVYVSS